MKGDVIEVLAGTFGWVFGKAFLFALAVAGGVLATGLAVPASGHLVSAAALPYLPVRSVVLGVALVLLLLFGVIFSGIWFVRSESAGWRAWLGILLGQAAVLLAAYSVVWQPGLPVVLVSAGLVAVLGTMVGAALWYAEAWRTSRWAGEMAQLQAENAVRRAELKARFGTESAGAAELGLE
jgi:hypothetical protein